MSSFTKKLILSCTGVIFASFLIVYFLFNFLVGNYIRAEAERELSGGMMDVVSLTYDFPFTLWTDVTIPHNVGIFNELSPVMETGRFAIELRQDFDGLTIGAVLPSPHPRWSIMDSLPMHTHVQSHVFAAVGFVTTIRPVRQSSFVAADVIIIGYDNEIITPVLDFLPSIQRANVEFLVSYYLANPAQFTTDQMQRVSGANNTYYLSVVRQPVQDNAISILMYTDISSAIDFTTTMNRILGLLLAVSGILSLVISITMSARFKKAIVRLCNYAETIGRGNFNEKAGAFNDTEFNQLSKSMDNMSNMLQTYENNQKQFFQNASHELRTPLMSIQGYAEGILGDIFTKEEAANVILSEGQKMTDLVNELLYISRMDSGTEILMSVLDAGVLLHECCERVKPIAQKFGKYVEIESPPQEIFVAADEEKLERAIINVLSNAIRYAESNVKVNYHEIGDNLEIVIEDDGAGINPKDLPHIFERFYKGENGNYGLGLAISKDIVKSLGGRITAENKNAPETGAVFIISLPVGTEAY